MDKEDPIISNPVEQAAPVMGAPRKNKPGFFKTKKGQILLIVIIIAATAGVTTAILTNVWSQMDQKTSEETSSSADEEATELGEVEESTGSQVAETAESTGVVQVLDLTKPLNTTAFEYSDATEENTDIGLSVAVNSDKQSATLTIDWEKFGPVAEADAYGGVHEYQIAGLSGAIQDVFIHGFGQSVGDEVIFFLMEDGTVEYLEMFKSASDAYGHTWKDVNYTYEYENDRIMGEHFESEGKLSGVSGAVKLYGAEANEKGNRTGGGATVIAATADGSFYDLGVILGKY